MEVNKLVSSLGVLCLALVFLPATAYAMPNFTRKYEKNCAMCHTQVPKLNKTGYEFRLAGFRFPDEIGEKETKFDLGEFFAARLQTTYTAKKHKDVAPAKNDSSSQLEFKEITLYPLTGSWGGNFGSIAELSMAPDDVFEIENAFVRGVYGSESGWFQGRLGVMHPWEGFGASDRPIGLSRPLFQKQRATGSPFFLWNLDEAAFEGGYYSAKTGTSIAGRIGNGIIWKEDGSGTGEPAQGGALAKRVGLPAQDAKSYELVLTQFLNKESGLTAYYYQTAVPSPNPFDTSGNLLPGPFTTDHLERLALYANYEVLPKRLNGLVGYGWGKDDLDDPSLAPNIGKSSGYFGEVDYFAIESVLAVGARYDAFDPSRKVSHNSQNAVSVFANYMWVPGLQLIGEYQHKTTEAGTSPGDNKDDQFQINCIFIW